jgi:hypothetical protein
MMLPSLLITFAMALGMQGNAVPAPLAASDCLKPIERTRLAAATRIDSRIKIYREVSEHFHQAVNGAIAKQNFEGVEDRIQCWREWLTASLKDIEANANRKKKSGALKDYEIQLRKSIVDMNNNRLKAPSSSLETFESWLTLARSARDRFVDILFQR